MAIFFKWVKGEEAFEASSLIDSEMPIFALAIQQKEGGVAMATITTLPNLRVPSDKQHAIIAYKEADSETQPLFRGRLLGVPLLSSKELWQLQFTAEPDDAQAQLQGLASSLKVAPYWDELFVDSLRLDQPAEVLEARSALFVWDRVSGKVGVSDLFKGKDTLTFTAHTILDGSLTVRMAEYPLDEVRVKVVAEWTQVLAGEANIFPLLARRFSGAMVNTVTPQSFKRAWPQPFTKLGRSGYVVLESSLEEVKPYSTGVLNIYPTFSPRFWVWDPQRQQAVSRRLKRSWFRGKLVIGWDYKQKRREIVEFRLKHHTGVGNTGRSRSFTLGLQAIADKSRDSFFLTDRGWAALEHAIEMARCHLAGSARCLEVEAKVPFAQGVRLHLDQNLILQAPQLVGGQIQGKVVEYQLLQQEDRAYAWFRLGVALAVPKPHPALPPPSSGYAASDYAPLTGAEYLLTASGIVVKGYSQKRPEKGLPGLETVVSQLVQEIVVRGDGQAQIAQVVANQYPQRSNPLEVLEECPTSFQVDFLDLKTTAVEEHKISLEIPEPWAACYEGEGSN